MQTDGLRAHPCADTAGIKEAVTKTSSRRLVIGPRKRQSAPPAPVGLTTAQLDGAITTWISECRGSGASTSYLSNISFLTGKLLWWMRRSDASQFDAACVKGFLSYVQTAHTLPEGRWGEMGRVRSDYNGVSGCPASTRYRPVKPATVADYWRILRALGNWCVKQGLLMTCPAEDVKKPLARSSDVSFHVFTDDEFCRLLNEAKKSPTAKRDTALVCFLLDTGARASEVCALNWADLDFAKRQASIVGKGAKPRTLHWSPATNQLLRAWAAHLDCSPEKTPRVGVWLAHRGGNSGGPLTRSGLLTLLLRLGDAAGVPHANPHTFRHTFATAFLRRGGQQMVLKELLGHSTLAMTNRYVKFTGLDLAQQAEQFSPVTYLIKKERSR